MARMLLSTGPQNLEHLKEARRLFEIGMVRVGTPRATPEDVAELRALIDRAARASSATRAPSSGQTSISIGGLRSSRATRICSAVSEAMLGWLFRFHSDLLIWSGHEDITLAEHAGDRRCDRGKGCRACRYRDGSPPEPLDRLLHSIRLMHVNDGAPDPARRPLWPGTATTSPARRRSWRS